MANTVSEFNVLESEQNSIYDVSELISKTKVDARRLQFANAGYGFGCNTFIQNGFMKVFDVIHLDSNDDYILIPVDDSFDLFMEEFMQWIAHRQFEHMLDIKLKEDYAFRVNHRDYKIKQKCLLCNCDTLYDVQNTRKALENFYNWEALDIHMCKTGYSKSKFLLEK